MPVKAKKIYKGVLKQERKIARKEVRKAKTMIHKKKKWTVAADAFGWKGGYDSKKGGWLRYGKEPVQTPGNAAYIPASSAHLWTTTYDKKQTKGGMVVKGRQKIASIKSSGAADNKAFDIAGSAVNVIIISPDAIGGQMATDARNYAYFKFKKVRFVAVLNASSTDTLNLGLAYEQDPTIGDFQTVTYDSMQASNNFVSTARKTPNPLVFEPKNINKSSQRMFHCELDTTTVPGKQQSQQGVLYGMFSQNDASGAVYGDLLMEFELELIDRMPDYGFTLSVGVVPEMRKVYYKLLSAAVAKAGMSPSANPSATLALLQNYAAVAVKRQEQFEEECAKVRQSEVLAMIERAGVQIPVRGGMRALRDLCTRAGLGDVPVGAALPVQVVDAAYSAYAPDVNKSLGIDQKITAVKAIAYGTTGGGIEAVTTNGSGALTVDTVGAALSDDEGVIVGAAKALSRAPPNSKEREEKSKPKAK